MENDIIETFDVDEDGILYTVIKHKDGYIEKLIKPGYENAITNTDQRQLDLEMNVQYLVDLAEINTEEG